MCIQKFIALLVAIFLLSSCAGMRSGGSGANILDNSEENAIFLQAVGMGAGVGLGAGLLLCNELDLNISETIACTGATTLVGGIAGYLVAGVQTDNLNQHRLKNDQMTTVLNQARQYNNKVVSYNFQLRKEIRRLKQAKSKNPKNIAARVSAAKSEFNSLEEAIKERRNRIAQLSDSNQKRTYKSTLRTLEVEKSRLKASIQKLKKFGSVGIGA